MENMNKRQTVDRKTNFLIRFLLDTEYRWIRHIVLAVSFFVMAANVVLLNFLDYKAILDIYIVGDIVLLASLYIGSVYLNIYVLMPRFLLKKRLGSYCFWLLVSVAVLLLIAFSSEYLLYRHYGVAPGEYSYFNKERIVGLEAVANFILYLACNAGATVTVLFRYSMNREKQVVKLEQDNLHSELEHLKKQANPQFLLNTLAKAGEMADKEPAFSSAVLVGLSRLLRYQLYDANRDYVLLTADIAYVRNFLALEKLLYPDFEYSVSIEGNTSRILLPPLLFILFVAYFTVRLTDTDGVGQFVRLLFKVEGNRLDFYCSGSAVTVLSEDEKRMNNSFQEIVTRLKLLYGTVFRIERKQACEEELYLSLIL